MRNYRWLALLLSILLLCGCGLEAPDTVWVK